MTVIAKTLLYGFIAGFSFFAWSSNSSVSTLINDGPYVFISEEQFNIKCVNNSQVIEKTVSTDQLPLTYNACHFPVTLQNTPPKAQTTVEYSTNAPIAAASDFNGQYDLFIQLLTHNKVIDQSGNWAFGRGHFVISGDVFARGDRVTELLWFLYKLDQQAEQAGGKLHLLLGNHEVMVLNGDLRYLNTKYLEVQRLLGVTLDGLFTQHTVLGAWLRSKAVLVKINDLLFVHGGLHPDLARENMSLSAINDIFRANLVKFELNAPRTEWGDYLHRTNGPIWYRGYFDENGATSADIDVLLKHFDISRLVVGHTSQNRVLSRYQGRVIAIDSGLKRGKYGEMLLVLNNEYWRGTLEGKRIMLKL